MNSSKKIAKSKSDKLVTKQQVRNMIDSKIKFDMELKYFAGSASPFAVDLSGSVVDVTPIPQGDTDQSRDGDEVTLQHIELGYQIVCADATNMVRVIMFQWLPNNTPSVSTILLSSGASYSPLSALSTDQRPLYRILYDKIHFLSLAANYNNGDMVKRKIPVAKAQFIAGSTAGTSHIYLLFISDSGAASHPTASYYVKTEYFDS